MTHSRFCHSIFSALCGCVAVLALALLPAGASAAPTHVFTGSFGTFTNPQSVITDDSGHVYVVDVGAGSVSKFDFTGNPVDFSALGTNTISGFFFDGPSAAQVAVDESNGPSDGNIYVADSFGGGIKVFASDGSALSTLDGSTTPAGFYSEPCGVAVDTSGKVYVGDFGGFVHRYIPSADPVANADYDSQLTGVNVCNVAADSGGNVYASAWPNGPLMRYPATEFGDPSAAQGTEISAESQAVAVNRANDHVFVARSADVVELTGSGDPVGTFGAGNVNDPRGAAVDPATGVVFVANSAGGDVSIFGPGPAVPDVRTGAATNTQQTTATLNGTVNPDGVTVSDCHFEYVDREGFLANGFAGASSAPCDPTPGAGNGDVAVHADVSGLEVGRPYRFRLVAGNANGTVEGATRNFSTAPAGFGIAKFDGGVFDADGEPFTQAGGHPYSAVATIEFPTHLDDSGELRTDGDPKNIHVNLPPGLVGNPQAMPKCTQEQLGQGGIFFAECPAASQVGVVTIKTVGNGSVPLVLKSGVYNMVTPPGTPAQFGFGAATVPLRANVSVGPGPDFGISLHVENISQGLGLVSSEFTLWGDPADPTHDAERICPGTNDGGCVSGAPRRPFLTLPTSCLGPQLTSMKVDTWDNPGNFYTASFLSHDNETPPNPIGADGCESVDFSPSLVAQSTSSQADSPTGLHVDLGLPQNENVSGTAQAHLKRAIVTLAEGMSVNPSAADGLKGCTPAQIDLATNQSPTCPNASKVGSVEIESPLVDHPLPGSVYLASQGTNPFNQLLALYIVADDPETGVVIKLPGKVDPDPDTGQLRATFDNNPQLPFSNLEVDFKSGSRANLIAPPTCGEYTTETELSPWSAADPDNPTPAETVESSSTFTVDAAPGGGPCVAGDPAQPGDPNDRNDLPFQPDFTAGTVSPSAGGYSPFVLKLSKPDGTQELKKIETTLPKGLTANISAIPKCPQADITPGIDGSTSCSAASQVGTVNVGAGAGPTPFHLVDQPVYLTEGYDGAPFGLAIDAHAKAGPFDLGHVVTRAKLNVDPATAQVSAESEELPNIIEGIPLHIRSVTVKMDRSDFIVNPTSCDPMQVTGTLTGGGADFPSPADDKTASVADHFQVAGCAGLGFSPKLTGAILNGQDGIHRSDHPNLRFSLRGVPGDANIAAASVTLPDSIQIDQANIGNLCSESQLAAVQCAGRSQIGIATATTPLLGTALSGPVYAVSGSGGLPRLAVILDGEVHLLVRSDTTTYRSPSGGASLVNTFPIVPDAPVSSFDVTIHGGPDGYLVNNRDICGARKPLTKKQKRKLKLLRGKPRKRLTRKLQRFRATPVTASASFTAHNGDTLSQSVPISADCPAAKSKKRGHRSRK